MTTVYLCQIPQFSNDYKNVGRFDSRLKQINYMQSHCILNLQTNAKIDNFTDSITLNYTINSNMRKCDYLYAQGSDGRYFFFFITNMEQNTNATTKIYLELDVWQTYHLELTLLPSFVERCHVKRWASTNIPTKEIVSEPFGNYESTVIKEENVPNNKGVYIITSTTPLGKVSNRPSGGNGGGGGDIPTPPSGTITSHDCIDGKGNKWLFPVGGRISSIYPNYPDGTYHGAIDISRNNLEPIYPPEDGFTVYRSGWNTGGYGNLCILYHEKTGTYHYFAHQNEQPLVSEGQKLNHTDCIGYVGSTGNSSGPHLHWEIRDSDLSTKINPCATPSLSVGMTITRGQGGY